MAPPNRATPRTSALVLSEAPTWAMLAACYGIWGAALWFSEALGPIGLLLLGGVSVALHASLQHEALHGHPTRNAAINEALVFPALNLCYPYRRFKEMHLRHHHDERLTDPFDDPESWYLAEGAWRRAGPLLRLILRINATLAGRLILGPALGVFGMWRADARRGGRKIREAYLRHAAGVALVLAYVWGVCGVDPLSYALLCAWPGLSLLTLRTYAEHRAAEAAAERTAIVEAEPVFGLLFLNNNLHSVHHEHPRVPWYELPALYRRDRERYLAENGGYRIAGYRELFRRWLFRAREPIAHPFMRRD